MRYLVLIFSVAVLFSSCTKENEKPQIDGTLLPGNWEVTDVEYSGTSTTTYLGVSSTATFTGSLDEGDLMVVFNENPNTYESSGSYTIELKTTIQGVESTSYQTFNDVFFPGTWDIEGDKLKVTNVSDLEQQGTIIELSETVMKLRVVQQETVSQGDATVYYDIDVLYNLTRM